MECSQFAIFEHALQINKTALNLHSSIAGQKFAVGMGTKTCTPFLKNCLGGLLARLIQVLDTTDGLTRFAR